MSELQLRDYQDECVDRTIAWLDTKRCNPLVIVPTGGGKSLIIAETCKRLLIDPGARILVASHVRELIEQDYDELKRWWPEAPVGLCSAGLGQYDLRQPITLGTIQTLYRRTLLLSRITHIVVDEAHMISRRKASRYQQLFAGIEGVARRRPSIIGYTATPYRLDSGLLHRGEDAMFDLVAANIPIMHLVREGYLVPLVNHEGESQIDTSALAIGQDGDFTAESLEVAALRHGVTERALAEVTALAAGRYHSWLLFAVSIKHAERIAAWLCHHQIAAKVISYQCSKADRDQMIADFRAGRLQALVSVNVLTIGFNAPRADLIALLRPTLSTALYIQMLGRGMRPFPGKTKAMVLDFGGNIRRHGPVTNPRMGLEAQIAAGCGAGLRVKLCPLCAFQQSVFTRSCPQCGHVFSSLSAASEQAQPVMDIAFPDPPQTRRPREVLEDYLKAQKVVADPFLDYLTELRASS